MLFIFSTPVLIRHLWQLKTIVFLHLCLICAALLKWKQGDQKIEKKNAQVLEKVAVTVAKQKIPKYFIKAKFESTKCLHQPPSKLSKCI